MAESVIVRQNSQFDIDVLALDPHDPDSHEFQPIGDVRRLTPYGMLLAGLGACTAIVLHTYAQNHGVPLEEVELRVRYDRVFADDCENCEGVDEYREHIALDIALSGDLAPEQRERLFRVSGYCPIHKMLAQGIEVASRLVG